MSHGLVAAQPVANDLDVAFFLPGLHAGGAERITLLLAGELQSLGLSVELVLGSTRGPLRDELPADVPVAELGTPNLRTAVLPLARHLRRTRPAVLMPSIVHADAVAMLASRIAHTSTVVVPRVSTTLSRLNEGRRPLVPRLRAGLALALYRRARLLVACSHGMRDDMVEAMGLSADRVRVLPNAVVGPHVAARAAEPVTHAWAADPVPIVVAVGSLTPAKNHQLLLDAVARLRPRRRVRVVILGDGPLRGALQAQAQRLGIAQDVELAGFDPNPFRWMARADVFVLSSDWEGLPGVLIEALACGANVVATDCRSGPREILAGGRHGRLTPVGDAQRMADALQAALDDPIRPDPASWRPYTTAAAAEGYRALVRELQGRAPVGGPLTGTPG